jgi:DNA-binding NarL/FixJ family response regulator
MIFLSDDERAQLRAQHRKERDKRICDRIKAVLLFDKGWSIAAIAEALLLSEDAIREHVSEYKESKKLKPENGGSTQKLLRAVRST